MAIEAKIVDESVFAPFVPEYMDNRSDPDPLVLEIRYVSPERNMKYAEGVKMKRRGREAKEGEYARISFKKFSENVRIKSGWILDGKPSTDIGLFFKWCPDDLRYEIDDAMSDYRILEDGHPGKFKIKK